MVSKIKFRPREYRLIEQKMMILNQYPDSECDISNNKLLWKGNLCPNPLSRIYQVKIEYTIHKRPQVIVYGDCIFNTELMPPHVFKIDRVKKEINICVHLPAEFNSHILIVKTIIPWTIEWLYFYEMWLATGEWCGGGHSC